MNGMVIGIVLFKKGSGMPARGIDFRPSALYFESSESDFKFQPGSGTHVVVELPV